MTAAKKIISVDRQLAEAAAPARGTVPIRLLGRVSEVADQPQLIAVCAGVHRPRRHLHLRAVINES